MRKGLFPPPPSPCSSTSSDDYLSQYSRQALFISRPTSPISRSASPFQSRPNSPTFCTRPTSPLQRVQSPSRGFITKRLVQDIYIDTQSEVGDMADEEGEQMPVPVQPMYANAPGFHWSTVPGKTGMHWVSIAEEQAYKRELKMRKQEQSWQREMETGAKIRAYIEMQLADRETAAMRARSISPSVRSASPRPMMATAMTQEAMQETASLGSTTPQTED